MYNPLFAFLGGVFLWSNGYFPQSVILTFNILIVPTVEYANILSHPCPLAYYLLKFVYFHMYHFAVWCGWCLFSHACIVYTQFERLWYTRKGTCHFNSLTACFFECHPRDPKWQDCLLCVEGLCVAPVDPGKQAALPRSEWFLCCGSLLWHHSLPYSCSVLLEVKPPVATNGKGSERKSGLGWALEFLTTHVRGWIQVCLLHTMNVCWPSWVIHTVLIQDISYTLQHTMPISWW